MKARFVASLVIVILAVILFGYFLIDDTPEAWLVRTSYAGALVAGLGVALLTLADLLDKRT